MKALQDSRVWIPMEFARRPRSLDEVHRWKALEFRLLLLHLGPVILSDFLSPEIMKHFNCLHCATRILCDPKDCIKKNPYAKEFLVYFVDQFKILYGETTMIYNVHNSIHISNDVLLYKNLDAFSAFLFENYLQGLKRLVRKGANSLAQIHRRLCERSHRHHESKTNEEYYPVALHPIAERLPRHYWNPHNLS